MRLVSASDREKQLRDNYAGSGVSFVKWVGKYNGTRSRVVMRCDTHGEWETVLASLVYKRTGCPRCCANRTLVECDVVTELTESLSAKGVRFLGFPDGFNGARSRVKAECTIHGEWVTDYVNITSCLSGCPSCAHNRQPTRQEREQDIDANLNGTDWEFVRWVHEGKVTAFSKMVLNCHTHGEWISNPNALLSKHYGCPSCATSGFDKNAPASAYCLISECGGYVKVGITNNLDARMKSLRRVTPFRFDLADHFESTEGAVCSAFEKAMLDKFDSAGFTGFDGATEWVKWNHEVLSWFRLMR